MWIWPASPLNPDYSLNLFFGQNTPAQPSKCNRLFGGMRARVAHFYGRNFLFLNLVTSRRQISFEAH